MATRASARVDAILTLAGAFLYAGTVAILLGTGGAPGAMPDAVENLRRWPGESRAALPTLLALLSVTGVLSMRAALAGRQVRAAAIGGAGAYASAYVAFLLMNDLHAPLLVLWMSVLWAWLAATAGALLPALVAAARGARA